MFDKFGEMALEVLFDAYGNSRRFKAESISSEHVLAALAMGDDNLAARSLASMNITADSIIAEMERTLLSGKKRDIAPAKFEVCHLPVEDLRFSPGASTLLRRALEIRTFFGHQFVEPEHLLLALIDTHDETATKLLEELGANFTYLGGHINGLLAERDALDPETPTLKETVIRGFAELVEAHAGVIQDLARLSASIGAPISNLPPRSEIAHIVVTAFMADFLFIQIGYHRYLLEETMKLLIRRAGSIDPEFAASTVSTSAQNLRADARHTLEFLWSHEFRHLSKLPEEADYDLIGSVIEDLWWTHSEEIALNQVFDEAIDDHRRGQMLDLQKRRLEISERFVRLRLRLNDVVRQCLLHRTFST